MISKALPPNLMENNMTQDALLSPANQIKIVGRGISNRPFLCILSLTEPDNSTMQTHFHRFYELLFDSSVGQLLGVGFTNTTYQIPRYTGDIIHVLAVLIIIYKLHRTRSCADVSLKSQALYALIFLTRYPDVLTYYISSYNICMKVFYVFSSFYVLFLMSYRFKSTYDRTVDGFSVEYLVVPCLVLAGLFNYQFNVMEILWSFSIFLESVAMLPQFHVLPRMHEAAGIMRLYLVAMFSYRGLYIVNSFLRYKFEGRFDPIATACGLMQLVLYLVYFLRSRCAAAPVKDVEGQGAQKDVTLYNADPSIVKSW